MKIAITGATGLIGTELCWNLIRKKHDLVIFSRDPQKARETLGVPADYKKNNSPISQTIDAVINLAGENIAGQRWTKEHKLRIAESRISGTRKLVEALNDLKIKPKVFISASAIGFYGDRGGEKLTEDSTGGTGFLSQVCKDWEHEANRFKGRVVLLRTGIVLSQQGGALEKMLTPFQMGVGGVLGTGKQWMTWIHIDDLVGLIEHALVDETLSGPLNGVAPEPVTNREFTRTLARVMKVKAPFSVPRIALKAALGEMSETVLASLKVQSVKTKDHAFKYKSLESALKNVVLPKGHERLYGRQWFKQPIGEVFRFFSDSKNLQELTPPRLNYKIKSMSIEEVQKDRLIDVQVKGPHQKWEHRYQFEEVQGGTLVTDQIVFEIPSGPMRQLVGPFVRSDIKKMFKYRRVKLNEIFSDLKERETTDQLR
jgi:uncharacterized protein